MSPNDPAGGRRHEGGRREHDEGGSDRRGARRRSSLLGYVLRSLAVVVVLVLVIIYTVRNTRPIYTTRGTVGEELRKRAPEIAATIAPKQSSEVTRLLATPRYQQEKRNFYENLMLLKQLDSAHAHCIDAFAVREAYVS